MSIYIGVDTGGTHTDVVLVDRRDGTLHTLKVPTTPENLSNGIVNGVRRILREAGKVSGDREIVFHYGTTLVTNLIVEDTSLPVGLLTTAGFRDVLAIGRAVRKPNIYDIHWRPLRPLVPRHLRLGIPERINHKGEIITPLDEQSVREQLRELKAKGVSSIAVCLLNAYANPVHELRVKELAKQEIPGLPVSISSEVAREFREYERTSTTVLNAFVVSPMVKHLDDLEQRIEAEGVRRKPFIMRGNGGIMSFNFAKLLPAAVTHSGPVAGIVGGNALAKSAGIADAITFDMGGTSSDVALISGGKPYSTTRGSLAGYPVLLPMLDLVTIGAGGGSIAYLDNAGGLKVGPRSAGSIPGPVCYAQGGENPTVTDANLVCGRINGDFFLNGDRPLRADLAAQAIHEKIATPLGLDVDSAALGILAIAEAHMANAIKLVSVQRGIDPRGFALIGFGGAGPLHAVSLAAALDIRRVLIPAAPGNVSATGLLAAEVRHDLALTRVSPLLGLDVDALAREFNGLAADMAVHLADEGVALENAQILRSVDLRYRGQAYELTLPLPSTAVDGRMLERLTQRFHEAHVNIYGYSLDHLAIELVNLRVTGISMPPASVWPERSRTTTRPIPIGTRRVVFGEIGPSEWPIYRFTEITSGHSIAGPAVIEYPGSTFIIPPGWSAQWDSCLHAHVTKSA